MFDANVLSQRTHSNVTDKRGCRALAVVRSDFVFCVWAQDGVDKRKDDGKVGYHGRNGCLYMRTTPLFTYLESFR